MELFFTSLLKLNVSVYVQIFRCPWTIRVKKWTYCWLIRCCMSLFGVTLNRLASHVTCILSAIYFLASFVLGFSSYQFPVEFRPRLSHGIHRAEVPTHRTKKGVPSQTDYDTTHHCKLRSTLAYKVADHGYGLAHGNNNELIKQETGQSLSAARNPISAYTPTRSLKRAFVPSYHIHLIKLLHKSVNVCTITTNTIGD